MADMGIHESAELVYSMLVQLMESAADEGELLDPNGVIFGLCKFYSELFEVTHWEGDALEVLGEYYRSMENYDVEGHFESGD
jgi:hypothetical protein